MHRHIIYNGIGGVASGVSFWVYTLAVGFYAWRACVRTRTHARTHPDKQV